MIVAHTEALDAFEVESGLGRVESSVSLRGIDSVVNGPRRTGLANRSASGFIFLFAGGTVPRARHELACRCDR